MGIYWADQVFADGYILDIFKVVAYLLHRIHFTGIFSSTTLSRESSFRWEFFFVATMTRVDQRVWKKKTDRGSYGGHARTTEATNLTCETRFLALALFPCVYMLMLFPLPSLFIFFFLLAVVTFFLYCTRPQQFSLWGFDVTSNGHGNTKGFYFLKIFLIFLEKLLIFSRSET